MGKGHNNNTGNELADALAKEGAMGKIPTTVSTSMCQVKTAARRTSLKEWRTSLLAMIICR
ncbi:Hypothetical protein FKW44_006872 [Caligus rogercresseyi]|uniref:RNase H type-1 domain-containing protein n=1 Tax=Caligus rogercresseyi TaxID=217165 RepID=A0A7T8QT46_CALRO|nr:Hypothetical protein FKW44_006872 [Caligus rogercresseyi]